MMRCYISAATHCQITKIARELLDHGYTPVYRPHEADEHEHKSLVVRDLIDACEFFYSDDTNDPVCAYEYQLAEMMRRHVVHSVQGLTRISCKPRMQLPSAPIAVDSWSIDAWNREWRGA